MYSLEEDGRVKYLIYALSGLRLAWSSGIVEGFLPVQECWSWIIHLSGVIGWEVVAAHCALRLTAVGDWRQLTVKSSELESIGVSLRKPPFHWYKYHFDVSWRYKSSLYTRWQSQQLINESSALHFSWLLSLLIAY